ncbi:MAG: hypothetical protein V4465_01255 [Patescibacteria group bacterium]
MENIVAPWRPLTDREANVVVQAYRDLCKMKDGEIPSTWLKLAFCEPRLLSVLANLVKHIDPKLAK